MLDKLISKNNNVKEIFNNMIESNQLSRIVNSNDFDKVLNDDEYKTYIINNNMIN